MEANKKIRVIFLYPELAAYMLACLEYLATAHQVEILIFRYDLNNEAPFQFKAHERIEVIEKSKLNSKEILKKCSDFSPDVILSAGWTDKDYRVVSKEFYQKGTPVLLGFDNPWKGTIKQRVATMISSFFLKPYYSHVWCSGVRQYEYARRLKFPQEKIITGVYCADTSLFKVDKNDKRTSPKTILYAGRFLDWKGVRELYQGFKELKEEFPNDWKLLMYGRGELKEELSETEEIEINDFIQPEELREVMQNVGAFCLPSYEEHWGVAVHEAAAAGCTMLVSDGVGAGTAFVRNGYNGYVFESKNKAALKSSLKNLMLTSDEERKEMSQRSIKMAEQITPELWSATLLSVLN